jgi:hypothetical protein
MQELRNLSFQSWLMIDSYSNSYTLVGKSIKAQTSERARNSPRWFGTAIWNP